MAMMSSLVVTGAIFLYGLRETHGLEVAADGGITCPEVFQTPGLCLSGNNELQDGGKLTCTAGDIEKAEGVEAKVEVQEITTGCTGANSIATFKADLTYTVSGGATRYDIGLYVASDAEADGYDGNCNIFSFGCSQGDNTPLPDDGDLCGDRQGFNREQGLEITAACVANADGEFKVPYCFSYSQNIDDITCTDANELFEGAPQPFQAIPGAPAKCQCDEFDLGTQICLVNLNLDATQLQPACTDSKLEDILISGDDIAIVSAAGDSFEYEISPGNDGPQVYVAGDDIAIANPSSETTYTIVVRRSGNDIECEDTFEITTPECGPDTCGDNFTEACGAGTSPVDGAVECKDAADAPTPCTTDICCDQDTCGDDFTGACDAGTSPVDGAVECLGEACSAGICCDQDTCGDDFTEDCGAGTSLVDGTVECKDAADAPTPCTNDICCEPDTCDDDFDVSNCELGTVPVADLTIECGEDCALTCCEPCDTAYGCAVVNGEGEDVSCASPPLNLIDGVAASRWGWYIEGTFVEGVEQVLTFDMYAGAGGNDLAKGEYAGTVVVTVNSDGSPGEPVASPEGDYCFDDIHVHVGNNLPTQKKGKTTTISVAPGQYTLSDIEEGTFYVIVHVGFACSPCGVPA